MVANRGQEPEMPRRNPNTQRVSKSCNCSLGQGVVHRIRTQAAYDVHQAQISTDAAQALAARIRGTSSRDAEQLVNSTFHIEDYKIHDVTDDEETIEEEPDADDEVIEEEDGTDDEVVQEEAEVCNNVNQEEQEVPDEVLHEEEETDEEDDDEGDEDAELLRVDDTQDPEVIQISDTDISETEGSVGSEESSVEVDDPSEDPGGMDVDVEDFVVGESDSDIAEEIPHAPPEIDPASDEDSVMSMSEDELGELDRIGDDDHYFGDSDEDMNDVDLESDHESSDEDMPEIPFEPALPMASSSQISRQPSIERNTNMSSEHAQSPSPEC